MHTQAAFVRKPTSRARLSLTFDALVMLRWVREEALSRLSGRHEELTRVAESTALKVVFVIGPCLEKHV